MSRLLLLLLCTVATVRGQFVVPDEDEQSFDDRLLRPCHIPTGNASFCVPLERCDMIQALIDNLQKPLPGDVSLIIADSFFCPQEGDQVKVCCPFQGIANPPPQRTPTIRKRGG